MVNPFDRNFFHFLGGFTLILCFSFSILYFTSRYTDVIDGKNITAEAESF